MQEVPLPDSTGTYLYQRIFTIYVKYNSHVDSIDTLIETGTWYNSCIVKYTLIDRSAACSCRPKKLDSIKYVLDIHVYNNCRYKNLYPK